MRKPGDKSWRDSGSVCRVSTSGRIVGLLLVFLICLSMALSAAEAMATHYQVTAYNSTNGGWGISYFKFEPESGRIQRVSYHSDDSLMIDENTSPVDLLSKQSRITGAVRATANGEGQFLSLNGFWLEDKGVKYQSMFDQIHINVKNDPFLNRVHQQLGDQLTGAQKSKNKQRESELLEKIRDLMAQTTTEKIIVRDYRMMAFVKPMSGRQVEISCDQSGRIRQIVQRNGVKVDYVCWPMSPDQVSFPTDETIAKTMLDDLLAKQRKALDPAAFEKARYLRLVGFRPLYGFSIEVDDNGAFVGQIVVNSNADKAGVKPDWRLIEVDGEPVAVLKKSAIYDLIHSKTGSIRLLFQISDRETKLVELDRKGADK